MPAPGDAYVLYEQSVVEQTSGGGAEQMVGCKLTDYTFALVWVEQGYPDGGEAGRLLAAVCTWDGGTDLSLGAPVVVQGQEDPDINSVLYPLDPRVVRVSDTTFLITYRLAWKTSNYWYAHHSGPYEGPQPQRLFAVVASAAAAGDRFEVSSGAPGDPTYGAPMANGSLSADLGGGHFAVPWSAAFATAPAGNTISVLSVTGLAVSESYRVNNVAHLPSLPPGIPNLISDGPNAFWGQGPDLLDRWVMPAGTMQAGPSLASTLHLQAAARDPSNGEITVLFWDSVFTTIRRSYYDWIAGPGEDVSLDVGQTGLGSLTLASFVIDDDGNAMNIWWQTSSSLGAFMSLDVWNFPRARTAGFIDDYSRTNQSLPLSDDSGFIPLANRLGNGAPSTGNIVLIPLGGLQFAVMASYITSPEGWAIRGGVLTAHYKDPPVAVAQSWHVGYLGWGGTAGHPFDH